MWFNIIKKSLIKANTDNHLLFLMDVVKLAYMKRYIEKLEEVVGATYVVEPWRRNTSQEFLPKAKSYLSSMNIDDFTDELYLPNPLPTYFKLKTGRDFGDKLSNNKIKRFVKDRLEYPDWVFDLKKEIAFTPEEIEDKGTKAAIDLHLGLGSTPNPVMQNKNLEERRREAIKRKPNTSRRKGQDPNRKREQRQKKTRSQRQAASQRKRREQDLKDRERREDEQRRFRNERRGF